jgi:hypothetical protein
LFTEETELLVEMFLLAAIRWDPLRTYEQFATDLSEQLQFVVEPKWIERHLEKMGFSLKQAQHKHVAKFTSANILYYGQYTTAVCLLPRFRLKFADESHFNSLGMHHGLQFSSLAYSLPYYLRSCSLCE